MQKVLITIKTILFELSDFANFLLFKLDSNETGKTNYFYGGII